MSQSLIQLDDAPTVEKSARISDCGLYRYELWRRWRPGKYALFIGLNPSTADAENDDNTIRRCISFARKWGYDALCMANLFAFRATDPKDMKAARDPVGIGNLSTLYRLADGAGIVIAAWGADGGFRNQDNQVVLGLEGVCKFHCLGLTKDGYPRHPLYLRKDSAPIPYQHKIP